MEEQKQLNLRLAGDLERLGGENALGQIKDMKKEIDILTEEVKTLTDELRERDRTCDMTSSELAQIDPVPELGTEDREIKFDLNGMRVAYVGGVESLTPHYREVIESFGGTFCYHCGRCTQGRKEMENLVDRTDIIFCPVDINAKMHADTSKEHVKREINHAISFAVRVSACLSGDWRNHAEKYDS